MQLDKKLIGHKFNAFTTTVEAGKIRLFCKAIGEENPIYVSEEAAKKAPGAPLSSVKLISPVARPSKAMAAPTNYHDHIQEMDAARVASGVRIPYSTLRGSRCCARMKARSEPGGPPFGGQESARLIAGCMRG